MKSICKIFVLSGILVMYAGVTMADDSTPTIAESGLATTNYVKGALLTELTKKQDTITGAATTITSSNLTASRAVISNGSGKVAVSDTTSTELGYVHGVTSAIQTQLNGKQPTLTTGTGGNIQGSNGVSVTKSGNVITVSGVGASTDAPGVVQLVDQITDANKTNTTMAVTPKAVNLQMEGVVSSVTNLNNNKQPKSTANYQVGGTNGSWQSITNAIAVDTVEGDDVLAVNPGTGTNAGKAVISATKGTPTQYGVVRVGEIPSGSATSTTYATIWVQ